MDEDLKTEIAALKQICDDMQKEIKRIDKIMMRNFRLDHDCQCSILDKTTLMDSATQDLRERVLKIEEYCFPPIKKDHDAIRHIIGNANGDEYEYNNLDYRPRYRQS